MTKSGGSVLSAPSISALGLQDYNKRRGQEEKKVIWVNLSAVLLGFNQTFT